jgi:hypothetical protein
MGFKPWLWLNIDWILRRKRPVQVPPRVGELCSTFTSAHFALFTSVGESRRTRRGVNLLNRNESHKDDGKP